MAVPDEMLAGRYRIEAPLGAGGMATVHRAYDVLLGRQVAIKILASNVAASPDHLERFGREGRAMAAISHPNLVAIHDVGWADETAGQTPFLVMELVPGGTLAERIATEGPLDPPTVAAIVDGLASALDTLHRAGIVHRDVKPQNVLLAPSGPKLADLGVVRVGDLADAGSADLTAPGTTPGTLRFLAPEVIFGQAAGPQADAYALAMVAFEALTGRSPRPATTLGDLVNGAWQPALPVSEAKPELGTAFDSAFAGALDLDPNRRSEPLSFAATLRAAAATWAESAPVAVGAMETEVTELSPMTGLATLNPTASRPGDATTVDNRPPPAPMVARPVPEVEQRPEVERVQEMERPPAARDADPLRSVLVALGVLVIVLGVIVVAALLLGGGGAGPGASPSSPASTAEPTEPTAAPSPTSTPIASDVAAARAALDAVVVAIEAARGGRDGLNGSDASELTALANDVRRALDVADFAAARGATNALEERVKDVADELDKKRRKALEDAVAALSEAIRPT